MTSAQRLATERYRGRQRQAGKQRVELRANAEDADLLRRLALVLRDEPRQAQFLRDWLRLQLDGSDVPLVVSLAMEDLADPAFDALFERQRDYGREVEL